MAVHASGGAALTQSDYIIAHVIGFLEDFLEGQSSALADLASLEELKAALDEVITEAVRPLVRTTTRGFKAINDRLDQLEQTQAEANAALADFMTWAQANFEQMATASAQNQELGLLLELAERNGGRHAR